MAIDHEKDGFNEKLLKKKLTKAPFVCVCVCEENPENLTQSLILPKFDPNFFLFIKNKYTINK